MPVYTLKIFNGNNPSNTGLYLSVTGSTPGQATVQYGMSSSGPFSNLPTGTSTSYSGTGSGGTPQNNDKLTITGTIKPNDNLTGAAVYSGTGASGAGYYRVPGIEADPCDWSATSN
jgi:hypothetical protein